MKEMIRKLRFQISVEPEKELDDLFNYVLGHDPEPEVIETTEATPEALQEAAAWLKTKCNECIGNRITVYAVEHFTADDDGEFVSGSDYDTAGEGKDEDMTLEAWATENGLEATYRQYSADVDAMVDALEEQGLPSHGSTYEALLESIRSCYPELFGEDGEDPDDEELDPEDREQMLQQVEADLEADPEIIEALR